MNDTAIKNFCTWARTALIEGVAQRMERYDVSEGAEAGLAAVGPLVLSPQEAAWRDDLLRLCREEGAGRLRDRAAYTWFNRIAAVRYMEVRVSVNLFFTSFAKQARRSRKGGFTGC
uniref:hypothetical protein n=1 Tax=Collinsella bouchesdurhonensis TaxID=1907654 RepID=UPI003567D227